MKDKYISIKLTFWLFATAIVFTLVILATGCASFDRAVLSPSQPLVTVERVSTNFVDSVVVSTNSIGEPTSSTVHVAVLRTNFVKELPSGATYSVKPSVLDAVDTAGGLPVPFAPIAGALATALLGAYASIRSRGLLNAELVRNIEFIRGEVRKVGGEDADAYVVSRLKASHEAARMSEAVRKLVDANT